MLQLPVPFSLLVTVAKISGAAKCAAAVFAPLLLPLLAATPEKVSAAEKQRLLLQ